MSAIASFFVISKSNFNEYCKLAKLVPHNSVPISRGSTDSNRGRVEAKNSVVQWTKEYYRELWDFLRKNGKAPFEYRWSGYTLGELLFWLNQTRNINLTEVRFVAADGNELDWIVFDETVKDKYLDSLNPANFKKRDLLQINQLQKKESDKALKAAASKLRKQDLELFAELRNSAERSLDEQCEAMMDGIEILYKYLQLVERQSVVILHIG